MWCALLLAPVWNWMTGVTVGITVATILGIVAWIKKMGKLQDTLENFRVTQSAEFTALRGEISGRIAALDSNVGALKTVTEVKHDSLNRELAGLHEEVKKHFFDCEQNIIGPMKKEIEERRRLVHV